MSCPNCPGCLYDLGGLCSCSCHISHDISALTLKLSQAVEALESAKAALSDNALSQSSGGSGITVDYYHSVIKKIDTTLRGLGG